MSAAPDFSFTVDGVEDGTLRVLRFEGRESVSETFEFDLELTSTDPDVEFASVVGKPACLEMLTDDGPRRVQGLVSRFELTRQGRKLTYYRARLVPRVWVLNLCTRSRIFQEKSTPDILQEVLEGMGVDKLRLALKRSYKPRLYCVQYRETDFAFASRLMEEEGIFYFFADADGSAEEMVLSDNAEVHEALPCGADPVLPFRQEEAGLTGTISVTHFAVRRSMRTGTVVLRDFDFERPSLDLTVTKESDEETTFEFYDYPGEFPDPGIGKSLAEVRLQQLRTGREVAEGESDCRAFTTGFKFELSGHPRFDGEYLLIGVTHSGNQPSAAEEEGSEAAEETVYTNRFFAIPSAVPFRPRRRTERPVVEGVQTAIVTGPAGEEIHTDQHGRIKVKFHWDREGSADEKSSTWIRVSQPQTGGSMLIPRIGWEVIVEFIEGDPDRPIVTGHVYNGEAAPPYGLPASKTMTSIQTATSPGGGSVNEIRFEDADGGMEFFMNASKDMNVAVANNETWLVKVDDTMDVGGKQTLRVKSDQTDEIGGNRSIEVKGNHSEKITGNMELKVTGDQTSEVKGSRKLNVTGVNETKIDGNVKLTIGGTNTVKVTGTESLDIGGAWTQKAKSLKQTISTTSKEMVGASKKTTVGAVYTITAAGKYGVTASSVALKSAGKVVIQASTIEIKGTGKIELQAGGSTISLGPAGIDIKAAAIVTINGALVKIN